jgi:hypothetical protein
MNFTNPNISPGELPSIETVQFYPLERTYLTAQRIALVVSMLGIAAVAIAAFFFIRQLQVPAVIWSTAAGFLVFTFFGWVGEGIGFRNSGYALRDKDVLFRHGWIIRKIRIVPLNRVQHVSVQSGPIERRFGLASVSVFTAGSAFADFTIKGITEKTARQIKDWISHQLNGAINN